MDFYHGAFAALVLGNSFFAYRQHQHDTQIQSSKVLEAEAQVAGMKEAAARFKRIYLPVYVLVMASDWLQGPYIYTLYKDEKGLSEKTVAALFVSGFVSAAISASFMGGLADRYGRRAACIVFCGAYILSSLTTISSDITILFLGRVLGGIGTTLIYSVFESWMVTEYFRQHLDESPLTLSSMFGVMHTFNSVVAIACGVLGEYFVKLTSTKTSPFIVSAVCLGPAAYLMLTQWNENYGDSGNAPPEAQGNERSGFAIIWQKKSILILGLISACFEGTMYLFVFFWSAALKSSHALAISMSSEAIGKGSSLDELAAQTLPFGIIFSTFMAGMMAGSLFFSLTTSGKGFITVSPAYLLTVSIAGASSCLLLTVLFRDERLTFGCFVLFEACVGVYFPSIAFAKGKIVDDGVRAKIYGILRIPLNIFVVVALSMTVEGDQYRDNVFIFCGGILLVAAVASSRIMHE